MKHLIVGTLTTFLGWTLTAALTLTAPVVAQQNSRQGTRTSQAGPDATTTCAVTFRSGSGHNATQYCVTRNGNITQFSRGGDEYIQAGDITEGYGVCDGTSNVGYFDYAFNDSGNLGPATFTSNATTATSTRISTDGIWQITNTITKVPASGTAPGAAKVAMTIKNLTNQARQIFVVRSADVDFLVGGETDVNNDFDFTNDTSFGLEPGFHSGLSLTNNSFSPSLIADAFTQNSSVGQDPCNPSAADQPFFGDGSIAMFYLFNVPRNGSKTVNMTYKPI